MNWADNYLQHPELPATTPEERAKYAAHFELLKEWNTRFNLVSRKSIENAFAIHYADSLYLADRASKHFTDDLPLIDLGTGAGFPGSVLAIRYPAKSILLLERSVKKQTFLAETVKALELKNVRLGETFIGREKVRAFVMSRAVLAPADFFGYVAPFLANTSRVAVTVGGLAEFPKAPPAFRLLENATYTLPGDSGGRKISIFEYVPRGTSR